MLKYLIITLIFIVIFIWETSGLLRKKEIKELIIFSFLTLIGLVLCIIGLIRDLI